ERVVAEALRTLHRWWQSLVIEPADVAVSRIVDELGLLPHAAAGELGETRAGAVLFLLDTLRAAALRGDASLSAALSALEAAFDDDDGEAPLRPGRRDVVRLMTLHKAKGLDAPVVILAAPFGERAPPFNSHIARGRDGHAVGWLRVAAKDGRTARTVARARGARARVRGGRRRASPVRCSQPRRGRAGGLQAAGQAPEEVSVAHAVPVRARTWRRAAAATRAGAAARDLR